MADVVAAVYEKALRLNAATIPYDTRHVNKAFVTSMTSLENQYANKPTPETSCWCLIYSSLYLTAKVFLKFYSTL